MLSTKEITRTTSSGSGVIRRKEAERKQMLRTPAGMVRAVAEEEEVMKAERLLFSSLSMPVLQLSSSERRVIARNIGGH